MDESSDAMEALKDWALDLLWPVKDLTPSHLGHKLQG